MASAATATGAGTAVPGLTARPHASSRDHLLTVVFATWTVVGLFLDGWAHSQILTELESFFTPWHAVFYSGYAVSAAWIIHLSMRHQQRVASFDVAAIPVGYGLGLVGVALFGLGGVGDMIWHTIFGIEAGVEALLSPTHLVLFLSGTLILTSPFRAMWHSNAGRKQTFGAFVPVLVSIVATTASNAFFFMYLSPFTDFSPTLGFVEWASTTGSAAPDLLDTSLALGIAMYLWTTLILVAPLLLALRRWDLPFGVATIMFTTTAFGLSVMEEFDGGEMVASALLGGLTTDLLVRWLRPGPERPGALRALGGLVPVVMWTANFLIIDLFWDLGWSVEFWSGTICLTALSGLALAYLMSPPLPPQDKPSAHDASLVESVR